MCTKLLKSAWVHHRWFGSIFFDRQNPYQLNMLLCLTPPKEKSDVDITFSPKQGITTIFTKQSHIRFSSEETAKTVALKLNTRQICVKCGDPRNCTKSMCSEWD